MKRALFALALVGVVASYLYAESLDNIQSLDGAQRRRLEAVIDASGGGGGSGTTTNFTWAVNFYQLVTATNGMSVSGDDSGLLKLRHKAATISGSTAYMGFYGGSDGNTRTGYIGDADTSEDFIYDNERTGKHKFLVNGNSVGYWDALGLNITSNLYVRPNSQTTNHVAYIQNAVTGKVGWRAEAGGASAMYEFHSWDWAGTGSQNSRTDRHKYIFKDTGTAANIWTWTTNATQGEFITLNTNVWAEVGHTKSSATGGNESVSVAFNINGTALTNLVVSQMSPTNCIPQQYEPGTAGNESTIAASKTLYLPAGTTIHPISNGSTPTTTRTCEFWITVFKVE